MAAFVAGQRPGPGSGSGSGWIFWINSSFLVHSSWFLIQNPLIFTWISCAHHQASQIGRPTARVIKRKPLPLPLSSRPKNQS